MEKTQTYKNHGRVVPTYHIGVLGIFFVNFCWHIYRATYDMSGESIMGFFMSIAFLLLFFTVRGMVLRVQDRLIRLEMRLRLRELLPQDLQSKIPQLTLDQLIGLRFASDAELVSLVRECAAGQLTSRKEIKMKVKDWQGDYLRA